VSLLHNYKAFRQGLNTFPHPIIHLPPQPNIINWHLRYLHFHLPSTMKSLLFILLHAAFLLALVSCQFNGSLTEWIAQENVTARGRIFANIGPQGQYASDADPGAICASPSTDTPNYYYQIRPQFDDSTDV
jgi:hypothetical protein